MSQAETQPVPVEAGRIPAPGEGAADWLPPVDIGETAEGFQVVVELCGVAREDVSVGFHEGRLTVWGERRREGAAETVHYRERRSGRFLRAFRFRTPVEGDRIAASLKQGLLTLTVPKRRPRRIPLEATS